MIDFKPKEKYNINDLVEVVRLLRSPEGCPWDRVQTHQSIRADLLEEAYEVADAIDKQDDVALVEETGDLLLQVAFHSVLAEERGAFGFDDVVDGIVKKLVFRHAHVFGDVKAENAEDALKTWNEQKMIEKNQTSTADTLRSVPDAFPALMKSAKVIKRASGLYSTDIQLDEIADKLYNLKTGEDLGDLLFGIVTLSRKLGLNAEEELEKRNTRFIEEIETLEKLS